jgi:two-component sensor histidine kinase
MIFRKTRVSPLAVAGAAAIAAIAMTLFSCSPAREPPAAVDGVLDLGGWDFDRDGPVLLRGEWRFFPGVLLSSGEAAIRSGAGTRKVPDFWKGADAAGVDGRGCGTYRLEVILPRTESGLALRYTTESTAFELDANGTLVASAGVPAASSADAVAAYRPGVARLPGPAAALDIVVRVSNHEYRSGGIWRAFQLGRESRLASGKRLSDMLVIGFASAVAAMAVNSLFLFFFRRRERSYLFFSISALIIALRALVTGEYVFVQALPGVGFDTLIRIEYVTAFLPLPLIELFLIELFPGRLGSRKKLAILLPNLPFILLIPFASLPVLTRSVLLFYPFLAASLVVVFIAVLLPALIQRTSGSVMIFAGFLVVAIAQANDSLFTSFIVNTGNILVFGFAAFILIQDLILAKRFTWALNEVESLSSELSTANALLKEENERYRIVQRHLEDLLAEKETLIKEVHHRVKNSLQIVSSIMGLEAHRSSDAELVRSYGAMRDRIRSISLAHEKLYGSASLKLIDLGDYVHGLVRQFETGFSSAGEKPGILVDVEPVPVPMDLCIDIGMLLSELVSNAFRHAILPRGRGEVAVRVRLEGKVLVIVVSDDGPGFPSGFSPDNLNSLGFRIVGSIVRKRGGTIGFPSSVGGTVEARIPFALQSEQKKEN